jgi:LysM repeat protein
MARYDAPPPPPQDTAAPVQDTAPSGKLDTLMKTVESSMHAGQWAEAHLLLSSIYGDPRISPEQAQQVTRLLDQMAATVIYSRQHLLEQPYRVQLGDTLERIAERYNVPPQLLAKINGIRDPRSLTPGRELKVIRGPFSAFVDLGKRELTLMVQGRYAGRFTIDVRTDPGALAGTYMVRSKNLGTSPGGTPAPGTFVIDLGNAVKIVSLGSAAYTGPPSPIQMAPRDMEDVFGILSVGSRVVIQR